MSKEDQVPQNLIETLLQTDVDIFPNVQKLVLIGCVSPLGSCEAERFFSVLRCVSANLRATLPEGRLAGLTMIAVCHTEALKLDTEEVVKCYIQAYPDASSATRCYLRIVQNNKINVRAV